MKVLVTGATGFVGRHLVKRLKEENIEVTEINSINFDSMWSLEKNSYEYIIHLAVKTAAGGYCQKHPGEQWIINSSINTDMLAYWQQFQQRATLITFGSSCGYNNDVKKTEKNYMLGEPETGYEVYGNIKRNLLVGLRALRKEFNMDSRYLIPSVFYGPEYDLDDKHFIFDLIRKIVNAKNGGDEVVLWGDGTQTRELIFVDDAVDIILQSMSPIAPKMFNLSSGKSYTLKTYAKTICDIVGYDYNLIKWDTKAFVGSKNKKLINTHLKGYKFTSLKKGLKKTIKYYEDSISSSK
jgi:GDP-L-fucose synthase|tara:strand:- start:777 stop:1661 length:885 start_codon:yes stop_codon:yes gene_type:complete